MSGPSAGSSSTMMGGSVIKVAEMSTCRCHASSNRGLRGGRFEGKGKSPIKQRACINKALVYIRLMHQRPNEMMSPIGGSKHQAIACLNGKAGLDASCSRIGTEQG